MDYTKGAVYSQLERNPPSPKFHVMFDAVGNTDVPLYTHSEKYLAPNGIFVSVGMTPQSMSSFIQTLHYVFEIARPAIFGGTRRTWK